MSKKIAIHWTCPVCRTAHCWQWSEADAAATDFGVTHMVCDHCEATTPMRARDRRLPGDCEVHMIPTTEEGSGVAAKASAQTRDLLARLKERGAVAVIWADDNETERREDL